jgi:hypothetical protein
VPHADTAIPHDHPNGNVGSLYREHRYAAPLPAPNALRLRSRVPPVDGHLRRCLTGKREQPEPIRSCQESILKLQHHIGGLENVGPVNIEKRIFVEPWPIFSYARQKKPALGRLLLTALEQSRD